MVELRIDQNQTSPRIVTSPTTVIEKKERKAPFKPGDAIDFLDERHFSDVDADSADVSREEAEPASWLLPRRRRSG